MTEDLDRREALRAIRDRLVEQLVLLEGLGEMRTATDLNPAIERLNLLLGEPADPEEIERLRRTFFMN